ncbi:hypothetical protein L1049_017058 [Liquidambar formosana]|uniref:Zinc finger BED domain-containing protein RICESLEEPER 2-like n=1 Tax=Liquidambar formosana TaxID=63359 RepID=A0AAP0S2B7_LIQFO
MSEDHEINVTVDPKMSGHVFHDEGDGHSEDGYSDDGYGDDAYIDKGYANEFDSENFVVDEKKVRQALARLICTDNVGPQIVEKEGFLRFSRCLNPSVQLGNVQSMKYECHEIYKEEKEKIKQILTTLDGQISLSLDILSGPSGIDYMCLTAHFIDDDWNAKKWVLYFCRLMGDDFTKVVLKSLSNWGIISKISTITLKNSCEYDELVEVLKDQVLKNKKLQLNSQLFRVYCCADILSLMVEDALNEIPEIIDKVRYLVTCGRPSLMWHNTYHTLKEVSELYSMGEFSKDEYDGIDIPPADEWKKVEGIYKLLENVHNVAKVLFETKHSTANIYLHNLQNLRESLIKESNGSDSFIRPVAEKLLKKFDKYWKDMFLVLAIATVLDPRFKMKYLEFSSSKYEGNDGNLQVTAVLEAIQSLYGDYSAHAFKIENSVSEGFPRSHEEGYHNPEDGFNGLREDKHVIQSDNSSPKSELDLYLEGPVIRWSQDFDILSFWRAASPEYPTLSRMARDFLAIPVSVVTSFEAYYTQKRRVDLDLLRSGQDVMNTLMCTRSWLQKD